MEMMITVIVMTALAACLLQAENLLMRYFHHTIVRVYIPKSVEAIVNVYACLVIALLALSFIRCAAWLPLVLHCLLALPVLHAAYFFDLRYRSLPYWSSNTLQLMASADGC